MGSDPVNPIFVTTDIPTVQDHNGNELVEVKIPIAAYKRLVDWCSVGRTMDNVLRCLESLDLETNKDDRNMAIEELEMLRGAFEDIHGAVRQHYTQIPDKLVEQPKK